MVPALAHKKRETERHTLKSSALETVSFFACDDNVYGICSTNKRRTEKRRRVVGNEEPYNSHFEHAAGLQRSVGLGFECLSTCQRW